MTDRSLVECLELHGVSKECLFTRWLGKGLYSAGKAKLNCHDYEESVVLLQRALKISEGNGMVRVDFFCSFLPVLYLPSSTTKLKLLNH